MSTSSEPPAAEPAAAQPVPSEPVPSEPAAGPAASEAAAEVVVVLPKHLHARPAGQVAQAAGRLSGTTVELVADGRTADARSILAVLGLGAVTGSQLRVRANGADAPAAVAAIAAILTAAED